MHQTDLDNWKYNKTKNTETKLISDYVLYAESNCIYIRRHLSNSGRKGVDWVPDAGDEAHTRWVQQTNP